MIKKIFSTLHIKAGKSIVHCYAPYNNLHIDPLGKIRMCCNQTDYLGQYPHQKLHDIWFGERRKKILEQIKNGIIPESCRNCVNDNLHTFSYSKTSFFHKEHTSFNKYPERIEFILSNRCNLKCLMCSWEYSDKHITCESEKNKIISYDNDGFLTEITPFIKKARSFMFSGGEPFLIHVYYKLWDLIEILNPNADVYIQTNGTVFNEKIKHIIEKLNVSLGFSIDSLDEKIYSEIRYGADLETVLNNLKKINEINIKKGIRNSCIVTPMPVNIYGIYDILNFCNENNLIFSFSIVESPVRFALWTLPSCELKKIIYYYDNINISLRSENEIKTKNHISFDNFINLIKKYYKMKLHNESNKKQILVALNAKCEGNYKKMINLLKEDNSETSVALNNALVRIVENTKQMHIDGIENIHDFISMIFNAEAVKQAYVELGEELFIKNGKNLIEDIKYIIETSSFDKLSLK